MLFVGSLFEIKAIFFYKKVRHFFGVLATGTLVREFHVFKGVERSLEEVSRPLNLPKYLYFFVKKFSIFWWACY